NNQWNLRDLKTVEEDQGKRTDYTYDEAQRLTSRNEPDKQTTFALDATDSIKQITETEGGTTTSTDFTTNNRHQVTAFDGHTLSYDANGNLEQVRDADGNQTNYFYDWRNQLIKAQDNQGQVVEFAYDALARRVEKRVTKAGETNVHRYVWDGWQTIEERNVADQVMSRYTYGNGIDEPVQIEKRNAGTGAMDTFIPMQDTNGSVLGLTDGAGNLVERVQYTPYGKPTFIYDHEPPKVDQVRLVDGNLRIRFSEPVNRETAEAAMKVKQGSDVVPGSLAYAENDRLVTFTPTSPFPQVALAVEITTGVEDLSSNHMTDPSTTQFTPTGAILLIYDRGPPKVQSIKLIAGTIRIDFDEEIDPASIANSLDLLDDQTATVATTVAPQGEKGIEISPTSALTPGTLYTLKVKTTITDLSGKLLSEVFEQRFVFESGNKLLYDLPAENEHETSSVANTTTFQGRDLDPETGLVFIRMRYFDPELGRFLQPDPMGYADSANLYQGFGNNPGNQTDPLGLQTSSDRQLQAANNVLRLQRERRTAEEASGVGSFLSAWGGDMWETIAKPWRHDLQELEEFKAGAGEVARRELGPDLWRSHASWTVDDIQKQNVGVPYRDTAERGAVEVGSVTGTAGQIIVQAGIEIVVWEIGGRLWRVAVERGQIIARLEELGPASGVGQGSATRSFSGRTASARWSHATTPWQREVYQRADIDWDLVRPQGAALAGKTNWEAATRGYSPGRINPSTGKWDDVVLHHANQDPRGSVVELWRSCHGAVPHQMDPPGPWRKENPAWADAWRREQAAYWRWRTGTYNPARTDRLRLPGDE
ncbi:MAG: Ig-like domain-containing protein, partial [Acidobacteria bacterium]|nr:Ig-like domain-containing protein [Acidobacteriota bacterium]